VLDGFHQFLVEDASIIRAGDSAQFRAAVFDFRDLDLLGAMRCEAMMAARGAGSCRRYVDGAPTRVAS